MPSTQVLPAAMGGRPLPSRTDAFRPSPAPSGTPAVVAARIDAALAQRTWSLAPTDRPRRCHVFLVAAGRALYREASGAEHDLAGPALLWLPAAAHGEVRLAAGGSGLHAAIAEDLVWRSIGGSPVGSGLRPLLDQAAIAPAERIAAQLPELSALALALVRESRDPQPGGSAMVELYVGLVLLHLWRAAGLAAATGLRGAGATTLQRFRQLVELHYRENLRIDEFASMLGVTRAHLHDACLRATSRTPLALVHDRLLEEARLRLEQTDLPVEQIAYGLGFRDAAYFNRFFKRLTGTTPGAYRTELSRSVRTDTPSSFAAWP